jgi:hypothetical protein
MEIQSGMRIVSPVQRDLRAMMAISEEIELEEIIQRKLRRPDKSEPFSESVRALKGEKLSYAEIRPYPTGDPAADLAAMKDTNSTHTHGWVLILHHYSAMRIVHDLHNLKDQHCRRCKMAIHTGFSCSLPDLVGNETYYNHDRLDEDPWPKKGLYLAFNHKSSVTRHAFTVTNGYTQEENLRHSIVIFDKEGKPTACGILRLPTLAWYADWELEPPSEVKT